MKQIQVLVKPLNNSYGMISGEFIFSLTMCVGFCIVLFSLNFTLSMVEVAQYIAFASARAHAAAHLDPNKQEQLAKDKFKELTNNNVLKPLFNNPDSNFFSVTDFEVRGGGQSGRNFENDYVSGDSTRIPQIGVRFTFIPRLLNIKMAFLGSTTDDDNPNGFSSKITGFLIREPTQSECWNLQIKERYSNILKLDPRYQILGGSNTSKYIPTEDNGC